MLNTQPVEPPVNSPSGTLLVHHIFSTIQGEGPHAGERAIFVRLSGCNLQCPLCDTDYTSLATPMTPLGLLEAVLEMTPQEVIERRGYLIVLTGGEPFRQNIGPAVEALLSHGFRVQVETNGTLYRELTPDLEGGPPPELTIVCSPKGAKVHPSLQPMITAYKYVLHADSVDPEDGLPTQALGHPANPRVARPHPRFTGRVYVNPVDVGNPVDNRRHMAAAARSCMRYGYILGLQLHKILDME